MATLNTAKDIKNRIQNWGHLRNHRSAFTHPLSWAGHQRTFSVASPIIARINAMTQKRITICGSDQPFFS